MSIRLNLHKQCRSGLSTDNYRMLPEHIEGNQMGWARSPQRPFGLKFLNSMPALHDLTISTITTLLFGLVHNTHTKQRRVKTKRMELKWAHSLGPEVGWTAALGTMFLPSFNRILLQHTSNNQEVQWPLQMGPWVIFAPPTKQSIEHHKFIAPHK